MKKEPMEFYTIEVDGVISVISASLLKSQALRSAKTTKFYHPQSIVNVVKVTIGDVQVIKEVKHA